MALGTCGGILGCFLWCAMGRGRLGVCKKLNPATLSACLGSAQSSRETNIKWKKKKGGGDHQEMPERAWGSAAVLLSAAEVELSPGFSQGFLGSCQRCQVGGQVPMKMQTRAGCKWRKA